MGTNDSSPEEQDADTATDEFDIDDEALAAASGGQNSNSTLIVYASTFIPFDSSF